MEIQSNQFIARSSDSLHNQNLQTALKRARSGFVDKRRKAIDLVPDFEAMKQRAQEVKRHTLEYLDLYLELFESNVEKAGGKVHWADTPEELAQIVLQISQEQKAQTITKGKSMIGEEASLNVHLEKAELEVVETDLGEYIIQLAKEPPSHIIAPAVHKTKDQVCDLFYEHHQLGKRKLEDIKTIVDEARSILREKFLSADVGITGANLLVAETGSIAIVTNEGNGDLTATIPKTHIVTASIEKIVPTLDDATSVLRVLARSATGQPTSTYTSFFNGPKHDSDLDGPDNFHVILLNNKRSEMLADEFREMLRCIRCGACMNHCPVYTNVGGHAYGAVYPGPMGSVLTPLLEGLEQSNTLPNASTFCGRCEEVCPMSIPLPNLLRQLRNRENKQALNPKWWRLGMGAYMKLLSRPKLYRVFNSALTFALRILGGKKHKIQHSILPNGWTDVRDLPTPENTTSFMRQWQKKEGPR